MAGQAESECSDAGAYCVDFAVILAGDSLRHGKLFSCENQRNSLERSGFDFGRSEPGF